MISVQPNAGLPELVDGQTHYPLSPQELAQWLERFVLEDGVNIIGGCCGTEAAHIAALDADAAPHRPRPPAAVAESAQRRCGRRRSPRSTARCALRQENAYLSIGERCNANGSRAFRRLQEQATGTAASRWGASRSRKARTRSISAPPLSGATRSPT